MGGDIVTREDNYLRGIKKGLPSNTIDTGGAVTTKMPVTGIEIPYENRLLLMDMIKALA